MKFKFALLTALVTLVNLAAPVQGDETGTILSSFAQGAGPDVGRLLQGLRELRPAPPQPILAVHGNGSHVIDGADGKQLCNLLKGVPISGARDANITSITSQEFGAMTGQDAACILGLVGFVDTFSRVAKEAWKKIGFAELVEIFQKGGWSDFRGKIMRIWMDANRSGLQTNILDRVNGQELCRLFKETPNYGYTRDDNIATLTQAEYERMGGPEVACILSHIQAFGTFQRLPKTAFRRMGPADIQDVMVNGGWSDSRPKILQLWMDAHRNP